MVQNNSFLILSPSRKRQSADYSNTQLQDDIGLLVRVEIADKVISIVNILLHVDKIERKFEFQNTDDYNFNCYSSSRTQALTNLQSILITLSYTFINNYCIQKLFKIQNRNCTPISKPQQKRYKQCIKSKGLIRQKIENQKYLFYQIAKQTG